jgi:hypothetical protein
MPPVFKKVPELSTLLSVRSEKAERLSLIIGTPQHKGCPHPALSRSLSARPCFVPRPSPTRTRRACFRENSAPLDNKPSPHQNNRLLEPLRNRRASGVGAHLIAPPAPGRNDKFSTKVLALS